MSTLPIIPATVIGSWSFPGWYAKLCDDAARNPSLYGPDDLEEALRDAVRLAVDDQLRAGADIITDGEMQRVDFNLGFYDYLSGLKRLPQGRLHGPPAHDQRSRYVCVEPLAAPKGLGLVKEYQRLRTITDAHVKMPIPGPFTLAGCIQGGEVYRDRKQITEALLPIINQEMKELVKLGVDFIQIDEPSFACHPPTSAPNPPLRSGEGGQGGPSSSPLPLRGRGVGGEGGVAASDGDPDYFLDVIRRTVEGVQAKTSMHLCFGNFRGRAVGWRSYKPLFPQLAKAAVDQLALEFASREMSEIELVKEIKPPKELAVGLVDVKNTWVEPPELVAERLRLTLKCIDRERVHVTPDCGFSQTARHVAVRKLRNMVEGIRMVRQDLGQP